MCHYLYYLIQNIPAVKRRIIDIENNRDFYNWPNFVFLRNDTQQQQQKVKKFRLIPKLLYVDLENL